MKSRALDVTLYDCRCFLSEIELLEMGCIEVAAKSGAVSPWQYNRWHELYDKVERLKGEEE